MQKRSARRSRFGAAGCRLGGNGAPAGEVYKPFKKETQFGNHFRPAPWYAEYAPEGGRRNAVRRCAFARPSPGALPFAAAGRPHNANDGGTKDPMPRLRRVFRTAPMAQSVFLTFSPVFFPAGRKFSCIRALFVCGWAHYNKAVVNCRPPAAWGRCYL